MSEHAKPQVVTAASPQHQADPEATATSTSSVKAAVPAEQSGAKTELQRAPAPQAPAHRDRPARDLHARVKEAWTQARFAAERPSTLQEAIAYAAAGEWTHHETGPARNAALAYAYLIGVPLLVIGRLLEWVAPRPTRLISALAVVTTVATAVNTIPLLHWLIPDWLTLPYWPPFSWIF